MKVRATAFALMATLACNPKSNSPEPKADRGVPDLMQYTDEDLYGELWEREQLSTRDRSLVTVSALIANGKTQQLHFHVPLALEHGVEPKELSEVVIHLAFYTGWPNSIEASQVLGEVFEEQDIEAPALDEELIQLDPEREQAREAAVAETAGQVAPGLAHFTNELLFGDIWRRPGLAPRDRSLVTVAGLIATGQAEQLTFHLNRAMENGLSQEEAGEVVAHLAFYTGWPRAFSALGPLKSVFESRETSEQGSPDNEDREPVPDHLTVQRYDDAETMTGPADRFTGEVRVESMFSAYPPGRTGGAMVHFEAGARTAWHTHPLGQMLLITDGVGWVQSEGEERITVRPGDVVRIPPNDRHWHGATSDSPMSHVAVLESLDGKATDWLEHVSDETYLGEADAE